jgi:hypothetical protein
MRVRVLAPTRIPLAAAADDVNDVADALGSRTSGHRAAGEETSDPVGSWVLR